jgi:hypothetical protein
MKLDLPLIVECVGVLATTAAIVVANCVLVRCILTRTCCGLVTLVTLVKTCGDCSDQAC